MAQGAEPAPRISIGDYWSQVVQEFTYLGSNVTDNLSMNPEIGKEIRGASTTFARRSKRVWENCKLTLLTKAAIYRACVLSVLL